MKYLIGLLALIAAASFFLVLPDHKNQVIVEREAIEPYLDQHPEIDDILANLEFWTNKYQMDSIQAIPLIQMGHINGQLFQKTGDIHRLRDAEALYTKANELSFSKNASLLRSMAQNLITQHRFREALEYADQALEIGENRNGSQLVRFDAMMELGQYEQAKQILSDLAKEKNSTDYLIRLAKYRDFIGELDSTVELLETCTQEKHGPTMDTWLASNLGDYYGHQGAIKKSFEAYCQTLDIDPDNWYALRGIAWIAYSHDKNPELALELVRAAKQRNQSPGLAVLEAEILMYQGSYHEANTLLKSFQEKVQTPAYGVMYRSHLAEMMAEDPITAVQAVALAEQEVRDRPSIETYDLLAWCKFLNAEFDEAKMIADQHLWDQTGEPGVLLHLSKIYAQAGDLKKSKFANSEVQSSAYELGPLTVNDL